MNALTSELFAQESGHETTLKFGYLGVIARGNAHIGGIISFKLCSANKKVTLWREGGPETFS